MSDNTRLANGLRCAVTLSNFFPSMAILDASSIFGGNPYGRKGILARATLTGGAPRSEIEGVRFADFAADGGSAVARGDGRRQTLEYSLGQVLDEMPVVPISSYSAASFFAPRVSPSGQYAAFFERRTTSALTVKIFDKSGRFVVASPPFPDWWGIAWTPGKELWCAATEGGGVQAVVYSLDFNGRRRMM
jgi:hypothetical protein